MSNARSSPDGVLDGQGRIVVLVFEFPVVSETFVVDHIIGLCKNGFNVALVGKRIDVPEARRALGMAQVDFVTLPRWSDIGPRQSLCILRTALRWIVRHPRLIFHSLTWRRALNGARLRDTLRSLDPALVHAHFGPNGVDAAIALAGSSVPLLVNFHGFDVTAFPARHGWRMYKTTLGRATPIAHSDFVERRLRECGLTGIERVTMGVDQTRFRAPDKQIVWPRPLRLASVGRLVPQKGHDLVLRALAILRRERPSLDARLRIIGAGPEETYLRTLVKELGLADVVSGPERLAHAEVATALQDVDLVIVASRRTSDGWEEAFCRVAIEAMSCGLPVAATPCGGLPDTIRAAGVVATTQSAAALAESIHSLISQASPDVWSRRTRAAAARYDIHHMDEDYLNVTRRALAAALIQSEPTDRYQQGWRQ